MTRLLKGFLALAIAVFWTAACGKPTARLFIDWGADYHTPAVQAYDSLPFSPGMTLLDAMNRAKDRGNPALQFEYKGSGKDCFLTCIGGVCNDETKRYAWVYKNYNDPDPSAVAFCVYELKANASVVWDYEYYGDKQRQ